MTYEQAKHDADLMLEVIRHNLMTGGNAKLAYNACEPEVQVLIWCQLTHTEKRMLGGIDEPDPLQLALQALAVEREARQLKKVCHMDDEMTASAKRYYSLLTAA
jgi:hypothetical protein